jgi:hypothetical protein
MKLRPSLIAVVAVMALAQRARAQASAGAITPMGTWRGTSLCLVKPSPCHDEVVVYRITPVKGSDSLSMDALKIVNGKEEEMGVLSCAFAARGASLTCPLRNGLWRFSVSRDSLVGELRLPDNTKFRDVRTARSH